VIAWRQGLEDVDVIWVDYSAVNLVEQVHQNESVEAHGVKSKTVSIVDQIIV